MFKECLSENVNDLMHLAVMLSRLYLETTQKKVAEKSKGMSTLKQGHL